MYRCFIDQLGWTPRIHWAGLGSAPFGWGRTNGKSKPRTSLASPRCASDLLRRRAKPFLMFAFLPSGQKNSTLSGAWDA